MRAIKKGLPDVYHKKISHNQPDREQETSRQEEQVGTE